MCVDPVDRCRDPPDQLSASGGLGDATGRPPAAAEGSACSTRQTYCQHPMDLPPRMWVPATDCLPVTSVPLTDPAPASAKVDDLVWCSDPPASERGARPRVRDLAGRNSRFRPPLKQVPTSATAAPPHAFEGPPSASAGLTAAAAGTGCCSSNPERRFSRFDVRGTDLALRCSRSSDRTGHVGGTCADR